MGRPVRVKQYRRLRPTVVPSLKALPGERDMPPVGPDKVVISVEPEKQDKTVEQARGKLESLKDRLRQAKEVRAEKRVKGQVTREAEARVQLLEGQARQAKRVVAREEEQAKLIRQQAAVQKGMAATSATQRALLGEELKRQRLATKEAALASKERQREQRERLRLQRARIAKSRAKGRKPLFKL